MARNLFRILLALSAAGCASPEPEGLRLSDPGSGAQVRFDLFKKPLPEIPFPNDIATRFDASSPTGRRINASMVAPTEWEVATRGQVDQLDGWGTFSPITVAFSKPLDVEVIFDRHRDNYDFRNDAVYLVDVTPGSADYCQPVPLDMGEGNFPLTIERFDKYYPNDPRFFNNQILFDEVEEDLNQNGRLDLGEDLDMDGVLDHPNLRSPAGHPLDDLLTFYERETNTLIMRPLVPLRENVTYAAVLTRRLLDAEGRPVRSPFRAINHAAQTEALRPLLQCLPPLGLSLEEVSFTWSFTTQSITRDFRVIRDGLYGVGPMAYLAKDFPPRVAKLPRARTSGIPATIIPGDEFYQLAVGLVPLLNSGKRTPQTDELVASHRFVGFHAFGEFDSPQFFPRQDEHGKPLPLYKQVWDLDPVTGRAFVRSERIRFWLAVPKPEYARRPAPVVLVGHGYTSNVLELLPYAGFFARYGLATLIIDAVSHGVELNDTDAMLARGYFEGKNLAPALDAVMNGRAIDFNGDGVRDSGADFWTSYVFHTRDVVRQSAVDFMALARLLRSFDGVQRWEFDVNRDGTPELAGDFDGDGQVDLGGNAPIHITGGSLGGIMSSILGGLEPHVEVAVPVAGGGGLADVGIRSTQGGVAEAVNLRMFGPLLLTLEAPDGALELWQYLPDRNKVGKARLGTVATRPSEGDTAVLHNLRSGEYRCARVQAKGLLRVAVSSDEGDPLKLELYPGPLPPQERSGCAIAEGTRPSLVIDSVGAAVTFQDRSWPEGSPLIALGDGFGLRRSSPEIRRFVGIAQMALDPADPVSYAPYFERWPFRYGTGEEVRTRALVINTIGDMNVPVSTGTSIARAAGFIDFKNPDPRWGKTPNRVLIDTGVLEATERTRRHLNSRGESVLMDVEHLASIDDGVDGYEVPRLSPPLRLVGPSASRGGMSGTLFPFVIPTGRHGFDLPDPAREFDLGALMFNMLGRYFATGGEELLFERCQLTWSCAWVPPLPPAPQP